VLVAGPREFAHTQEAAEFERAFEFAESVARFRCVQRCDSGCHYLYELVNRPSPGWRWLVRRDTGDMFAERV
jgi:hypothetical protein